ncbi:MAG: hypothetical protein C0598_01370 [Marinilabiliales bacterium]|nr:MAG: hypothetical protein C0598_01370 [Marinilabiliales bacterium]
MLFTNIDVVAQFDTEYVDTSEFKILYNRSKTYGIELNNLGLGIQYRTGKRLSYFSTRMWEFDFSYLKSYKQYKIQKPYQNAKRYIYGKQNDVFFLRAGIIKKKLLNRKPYWGGVEVRFMYGGGLSFGLAKPYYLYVIYQIDNTDSYEILPKVYDEDPVNRDWLDEFGRAPFSRGFNEISIHPGAYGRIGLSFEFGKDPTKLKVLEVGLLVDVLPYGVSVMAYNPNDIVFPQLFFSFSLGKRFNKY